MTTGKTFEARVKDYIDSVQTTNKNGSYSTNAYELSLEKLCVNLSRLTGKMTYTLEITEAEAEAYFKSKRLEWLTSGSSWIRKAAEKI